MGLLSRSCAPALALAGCTSDIAVDLALVDGPRVLAVSSVPAEAAPGDTVVLAALQVDADGVRDEAPVWTACTTRRPLAELGPVADACIDGEPGAGIELGAAAQLVAALPDDGCRLFGPDPPPAQAGQAQARPVDPDHTGGYYQPIVVDAGDELATFGVRLECGIAGANQAEAAELRMRRRDNVAPRIARVEVDGLPGAEDVPDRKVEVEAGAAVELRIEWAECSRTPRCGDAQCTLDETVESCAAECDEGSGCSGAEWYAYFDPVALEVAVTREAIGVAWYATAGRFDDARTGRDGSDDARTSDNVWTAPDEPGLVSMWIVLRDDRGASSWRTLLVEVR